MTELETSIAIRHCESLDELSACVALQKEVWGFDPTDLVPRRIFVVSLKIGGQVIGAYDGETLIGFAMALPGIHAGRPYLHSHMLAVREGYRNRGLGQRLKRFQRDDALARGLALMEWTFDPLEAKNAFLNIQKLGAVVRRYAVNFYGVSSSRLHGEVPTDRLYAEWWIGSPRVTGRLKGETPLPRQVEQTILLPPDLSQWRHSPAHRERVLEVQWENRRRFEHAFACGLAVIGFAIEADGTGVYQLGRLEEPGIGF